jgi:hypothetical protein
VQPDSLLLETSGPAGPFIRVIGDEVKGGLSGSMAMRRSTGLVCGVLKGTRDYKAVRGGWITLVPALLEVLGPVATVRRAQVTDQDVMDVLLQFDQLAQLQGRYDLLSIMGSLLGMRHARRPSSVASSDTATRSSRPAGPTHRSVSPEGRRGCPR